MIANPCTKGEFGAAHSKLNTFEALRSRLVAVSSPVVAMLLVDDDNDDDVDDVSDVSRDHEITVPSNAALAKNKRVF
jgi:hypothetical protein